MTDSIRVMSVCGDPGGARAISPVIKLLQAEGQVSLFNFVYNQAVNIFEENALVAQSLPDDVSREFIEQVFAEIQPDFVFVATSCNQSNWERYFTQEAQNRGIKNSALLDYWSNYEARFENVEGELQFLPDEVIVMDDYAKDVMVELGFPENQLIALGQPAFDALADCAKNFTKETEREMRQQLSLSESDIMVVFASQPLSELQSLSTRVEKLPYNELEVLEEVIRALETLQQSTRQQIHLFILPHPRENAHKYDQYTSDSIEIHIETKQESLQMVLASDLLIGMTTILLLQAAYMHKIALSLQLNAVEQACSESDMGKYIVSAYQVEEFLRLLKLYLFDTDMRLAQIQLLGDAHSNQNATRRVADYIYKNTSAIQEEVSICN